MQEQICEAIRTKRLIRFHYAAGGMPGYRVVEPHMIAANSLQHLALSAWYVSGESESGEGPGWREYLLDSISDVTVLEKEFPGPRPGYRPDGGTKFHNVRCALEVP
jgi:hypothetical protein